MRTLSPCHQSSARGRSVTVRVSSQHATTAAAAQADSYCSPGQVFGGKWNSRKRGGWKVITNKSYCNDQLLLTKPLVCVCTYLRQGHNT